MRPLFVNNKQYVQSVPSPNGGGVNVPPGKAVEGEFFRILAEYKILDPILDIDESLIVFRYGSPSITTLKEISLPPVLPKISEHVVSPEVNTDTLNNLEQLSESLSNNFNSSSISNFNKKDISKLNLEQLRAYATNLNINILGTETKRELIKLISIKEG